MAGDGDNSGKGEQRRSPRLGMFKMNVVAHEYFESQFNHLQERFVEWTNSVFVLCVGIIVIIKEFDDLPFDVISPAYAGE